MSDLMTIILVVELFGSLASLFIYRVLPSRDRAEIWYNIACYAKATGAAIEYKESQYREMKINMGVRG